jgi:hypothetical protein
VVLVGTSITGRVLPEFFKEQGLEVYNLGLDGCIPRTGLELVLKKDKLPKIILLEAPSYPRDRRANDIEILEAIQGITFKLGRFLPIVRASSRPSSILYSLLKKKQDARADTGALPGKGVPTVPSAVPAAVPVQASGQTPEVINDPEIEIKSLEQTIGSLTARNVEVILVRLPAGNQKTRIETGQPDLADRLSASLSLKILDVASTLKTRGVILSFSDGLHMRGPSAREAAKVMGERLKS